MFEINGCQEPLCFENRYRALEMSHNEKKITKPYHIHSVCNRYSSDKYNEDYVTGDQKCPYVKKKLTCMYQCLNVQQS